MIVPKEGHFVTRDEPVSLFMHGSPWPYDTRVPLIFHGAAVRRGGQTVPARHQDIAPTILSLLGLPPPPTMTGRVLAVAARPAGPAPRAVLLIVMDAFRADYLERFADVLPNLTRLKREGASFPQAQVDYQPSATGVAHATIATGTDPAGHGIVVNTLYDAVLGTTVDAFAGRVPRNLMAPSLADVWQDATSGRAIVAAQAGLFYAAGALAGHGACQVNGRFAFAAAYERATGRWITGDECYRLHPSLASRDARTVWEAAGGRWMGHAIDSPDNVRQTALFAGFEADALLGVIEAEPIGADDVADLLLWNLKTADFVGHQYGPDSPEVAESVKAVDDAVGRVVAAVAAKAGADRTLVVVTADHGMPAIGADASRRHFAPDIVAAANARLDPEGKRVIRNYEASNAQLYVDTERLRALGLSLADVSRYLESLPFVFAAYTEDEVRAAARR
jgi:predicted AlkP superfamily pyrophosphatase or phosphodiesterase